MGSGFSAVVTERWTAGSGPGDEDAVNGLGSDAVKGLGSQGLQRGARVS